MRSVVQVFIVLFAVPVIGWRPCATQYVRRSRLRSSVAVLTVTERDFNDFERECFGNEVSCDAWYYGESPLERKQERIESAEEKSARLARIDELMAMGRRVATERASKAAAEAEARERIKSLR